MARQEAASTRKSRLNATRAPDVNFDLVRDLTAAIAEAEAAATDAAHQLKRDARQARRAYFTSMLEDADPQKVWDFVQWTKPRRLDAAATIVAPDGTPAQTTAALRDVFQHQFTPSDAAPVDLRFLDEFPQHAERDFPKFSPTEFHECLQGTSNSSAPGPDHLSWFWLKQLTKRHPGIVGALLALFDACIKFEIHPTVFKWSVTVVIPKPNKPDYSRAKAYRPIVLLNCLGKLLEKMIAKRMQFEGQKYGILHPCQFGGTLQHSTTDAGVQLVHNVRQAWKRGLNTSALLLDVSQFFPSIHHGAMIGILRTQGFNSALCGYFADYLVGRTTQFRYNGCLMDPADFTVGVGQGSALSPILSGLYVAPVLHHSAPIQHAASTNATLQFYVDDGLISVAAPPLGPDDSYFAQLQLNNAVLAHLYHDLASGLLRLGLRVEADKLELMHFVRHKAGAKAFPTSQPLGPDLALRLPTGPTRVRPKDTMRYLGFFLDPQLTFRAHIRQCVNKASSAVHAFRMLGNSVRGLRAHDRRRLYIANIIPITLYGAQLWWHPGWHKVQWIAQELRKVQARAARWITGCFRTTPTGAMDVLARLIPIRHQVNTYMQRAALRLRTLHTGHPLRASLSPYWQVATTNIVAPFPLETASPLTPDQSPLHHADWMARQSSEDFAPLHNECRPGHRLLDTYSHRIILDLTAPRKASPEFRDWKLEVFIPELTRALAGRFSAVLFTDGSHKLNDDGHCAGAAWALFRPHTPTIHGSFGVGTASPYDAEMAALARGIRAATDACHPDTRTLHIYVDNRAAADAIFRSKLGPSQLLSILACQRARDFLKHDSRRTIHVHWCPAHVNIAQNELVDRLAKSALALPQPDFVSFSSARQHARARALTAWRAEARHERYRGHHSLLRPDPGSYCHMDDKTHPFMSKTNPLPPALAARWYRFLTGHYPHGAYRSRFHLPGPTACQCGHPLETTTHTLYDCTLWLRPPHLRRPDVPRQPPDPDDALAFGDPDDFDPRLADDDFIPPEFHPDPTVVLDFLRLNPMVASFDWPDLLARADDDHRADRHPSVAETAIWMHTEGKLRALRALDDPAVHADAGALMLFAKEWHADQEAQDFCDTPHEVLCPRYPYPQEAPQVGQRTQRRTQGSTEIRREGERGHAGASDDADEDEDGDGRAREDGREEADTPRDAHRGRPRPRTPTPIAEGIDDWIDRLMRERGLDALTG